MAARTPRPSDLRGAAARALLWLLRASMVILAAVAGIFLGLTPATAVVAPPPTSAAATSYDGCASVAHARELAVLRHGVGVAAGDESLSLGGGSAYVGDFAVAAESASSSFGNLTHAAEGIKPYSQLSKVTAGQGGKIQAHHLIERRFSDVLGGNTNDWASVVLTRGEHQVFTNAWRQAIPYGPEGTGIATRAQVEGAARQIYADYSEFLQSLGL